MPVPVPKRQPAHRVIKPTRSTSNNGRPSPVSLAGDEPPSELPSWRRCHRPALVVDSAQGFTNKNKGLSSPPKPAVHSPTVPAMRLIVHHNKLPSPVHHPSIPFAPFNDPPAAIPAAPVDALDVPQPPCPYPSLFDKPDPAAYQQQPPSIPKDNLPAPTHLVTPTASAGYKKLAQPLSEWVANFVWKICTTDMPLPSAIVRHPTGPVMPYAASPPAHIAPAVHSMLMSTLLQPSAVFLAIWYIIRLPVSFATDPWATPTELESKFRAYLSDNHDSAHESSECVAPFRLIVLGCMLANKWLDDHTFSNKTWHSVTQVPNKVLNQLEACALAMFDNSLSISNSDWSEFLDYLLNYHSSLLHSPHPQPISRPSTNPHGIVRKAIIDIIQAPINASFDSAFPQPVFMPLEEDQRVKEPEDKKPVTVELIDLDDEDGPLREEYLPKRRISTAIKSVERQQNSHIVDENWMVQKPTTAEKCLPPPAKWSPPEDEPILRERNRASGQYVAVQPPSLVQYAAQLPVYASSEYRPGIWGGHSLGYLFDLPVPMMHLPPPSAAAVAYTSPFGVPVMSIPPPSAPAQSHSRSQSLALSFDQGSSHQVPNRARSFSVDHCCEGCDAAGRGIPLPSLAMWGSSAVGGYGSFGLNSAYQTAWLRA